MCIDKYYYLGRLGIIFSAYSDILHKMFVLVGLTQSMTNSIITL